MFNQTSSKGEDPPNNPPLKYSVSPLEYPEPPFCIWTFCNTRRTKSKPKYAPDPVPLDVDVGTTLLKERFMVPAVYTELFIPLTKLFIPEKLFEPPPINEL